MRCFRVFSVGLGPCAASPSGGLGASRGGQWVGQPGLSSRRLSGLRCLRCRRTGGNTRGSDRWARRLGRERGRDIDLVVPDVEVVGHIAGGFEAGLAVDERGDQPRRHCLGPRPVGGPEVAGRHADAQHNVFAIGGLGHHKHPHLEPVVLHADVDLGVAEAPDGHLEPVADRGEPAQEGVGPHHLVGRGEVGPVGGHLGDCRDGRVAMHFGEVAGVDAVLGGLLRMGAQPPLVHGQGAPVGGVDLRRLKPGRPPVGVAPHQDPAIAVEHGQGLQAGLDGALLAFVGLGAASSAVELEAMEGAAEVLAPHSATFAEVGAQVGTVGVDHPHVAAHGPVQDHLAAEEGAREHGAGGHVVGGGEGVPACRERREVGRLGHGTLPWVAGRGPGALMGLCGVEG